MARHPDPNAREALLRAARTEFARHGLDRARIEDIARGAGLSKGAFYLHFESKAEVLRVLVQRFVAVLEEASARRNERELEFMREHGPLPSGKAARGRWIQAFAGFASAQDVEILETFWRHREVLAAIDGAAGEDWEGVVREFRLRLREQLAGDFARQQRLGRLRTDLDPDALIDVVTGAYEALARRLPSLKRKPDLARWSRTVGSVLLTGILPAPAPRTPKN